MFRSAKFHIFLILGIVFLLDAFFFRYLLWKLPNEFAWNAHHFYNFLYETKKVQIKEKTKPRIFIVGSSIAYYSIDKELLENEILLRSGKEVDVEYFSYAGNSPLYTYLFLDTLLGMEPDLVVYPVNFIDFRLHRAFVDNPHLNLENMDEDILIRDAVTEVEAPQAKYIFPWETLTEFWEYLDWERRGQLFIAGLWKFYGYKDIYWKALETLYNHRFGRNSSYHAYSGVQIPERVNSLGWTGASFSFQVTEKIRQEGFWIEVVPEILKDKPLEVKIQFTSEFDSSGSKENPIDSGVEASHSKHSQKVLYATPGWKKIILDPQFFSHSPHPYLKVELSQVWYSYEAEGFLKDYHRDPMGVRLTQIFGLDSPKQNRQYIREERLEDLRYVDMDDESYREYFFYRLLEDLHLRPGIRYLYEIAEAKKKLSREKFRPILHFEYLKKSTEVLKDNNIPILLINNPENPISLDWYGESEWYADYLQYLRSMESRQVRFLDWKGALKMQDFSDFHHFTYPGMVKMNSVYAKEILDFSAF